MKLLFRHVSVEIEKKPILQSVSGIAKQGEILAILGPSGAGKSTLLNALAGRKEIKHGSITLDNQPIRKELKRKICYVMQSDIFFPNLTMMETLTYTAMLRLPEKMSKDMKKKRVEDIIDVLDLKKCRNTAMGGVGVPGLSGGEMKRVSIACEMLVNPQVLLLDEPTSGLDAAIAYSVMKIMYKYAKQFNKTIISTIHQPSSQIFHMFDNIMLLTSGQVAYFGKCDQVVRFFSSVGLVCQPHYNPADFIMEKIKESEETEKRVVDHYTEMKHDYAPSELLTHVEDETGSKPTKRRSFFDLFKFSSKSSLNSSSSAEGSGTPAAGASVARVQSLPVLSKFTEVSSPKFSIRSEKRNSEGGNTRVDKDSDKTKSFTILPAVGECNLAYTPSSSPVVEKAHDTLFHKVEVSIDDEDEATSSVGNGTMNGGARTMVELKRQDTDMLVEQYYDETAKWQTGFITQYTVLTCRTMRQGRHRILSSVNLVRGFIMAVLSGIFWFKLPREEATVNDRLGVLFFLTTFWSFQPLFDAILSFPAERQIINRERSSGAYRLSSYYFAKMTSEIPLMLIMPTAFHAIVYWMAGLAPTPGAYFQSLGLLLFHIINSQGIGICIGIGIENFEDSITVGAVTTLAAYLTAGYLQRSMPAWIAWAGTISFVRYPFHALALTEFSGCQLFKCAGGNITVFPECTTNGTSGYVTGTRMLESMDMESPLWIDVVAIAVFTLCLRLFGYFILRYIKNPNRKK